MNVVEAAQSEWASTVFFAPKKDVFPLFSIYIYHYV